MLKHRSKYELEKCFHCSLCLYVGKTRNSLQRHLLVHKKAGELKMYKCDKCPFESKHHNSLRYHDLTHKEVKKIFKCDQCGYETAHKANLTNHMITHKELGETPIYECAMCEFKTKYKHNLKSHSETCKKRRKRNKQKRNYIFIYFLNCKKCDSSNIKSNNLILFLVKKMNKSSQCQLTNFIIPLYNSQCEEKNISWIKVLMCIC